LFLGENHEQLKINFTRNEDIRKLTCRSRNTIGQAEASVDVDILCKFRINFSRKKMQKYS